MEIIQKTELLRLIIFIYATIQQKENVYFPKAKIVEGGQKTE